ncbi:MAG: hypothetical protein ABIN61_09195 [candidate division WOR-3 bacterium]
MNRGIRMIKKSTIILIFLVFPIIAKAEPYKPYPILFVHGLGAHSGTWGAPTISRSDFIPKDSVRSDHTYDHFLDYMTPYAIEWWRVDKSYTHPDSSPAYPNKTFLEGGNSLSVNRCPFSVKRKNNGEEKK